MDADVWMRNWATRRKEKLQASLKLYECGQARAHEMRGSQQVDTTNEHIAELREFIAELDEIIVRSGGADGGGD